MFEAGVLALIMEEIRFSVDDFVAAIQKPPPFFASSDLEQSTNGMK